MKCDRSSASCREIEGRLDHIEDQPLKNFYIFFLVLQELLLKLGLIFWKSQNSDSKYLTLNGISILTLLVRPVRSTVTKYNAQSCKVFMFISLFSMSPCTSGTTSVTTVSFTCLWEKYTRSDVWNGAQTKEDLTISIYEALLNAFISHIWSLCPMRVTV